MWKNSLPGIIPHSIPINVKIVYIEDSYLSAKLFEILVKELVEDVELEIFTNLKAYNGKFDENFFFIDNHLPDGKGLQFILDNITNFNVTKTKITLITAGYLKIEEEQSIKRIPNFSIVNKPFERNDILKILKHHVR